MNIKEIIGKGIILLAYTAFAMSMVVGCAIS